MSKVKLNQTEIATLDSLGLVGEARSKAEQTLLSPKEAKAQAANVRRTQFSIKKHTTGTVSVLGLGRQFPVALYPGEWDVLISHIEEIKTALQGMPRRSK